MLWLLSLCPFVVMLVLLLHGRGGRRTAWPSFRIPPAEETALSVRRFQKAAERDRMVDFVWERYSQGRALLLEDFRRAAAARPRRRAPGAGKAPIPRWI